MQAFRKLEKRLLLSTEERGKGEGLIHWKSREPHVFVNLISRQNKSKFP